MFRSSAWLFGLLALAIPLALHLWSRRPGRVLRVGTTRHLGALPPVRRLSLRLTERLLLALRLGVFALVALALAEPSLPLPGGGSAAPVVLVAPEVRGDSRAWLGDRRLDSLRRSGAELRLLVAGVPEIDAETVAAPEIPLWDLVAEADRRLAPGRPFVVVAAARPSALGPRRPVLGRPVTWVEPASRAPGWSIAAAWSGRADAVELLLSRGDGDARQLVQASVPARAGVHPLADAPAVEILASGAGHLAVRLLGQGAERDAVPVQAVTPLRVQVVADSAARRRLVTAAEVIGEATGRPVVAAASDSADLVLSTSADAPGRTRIVVPDAWLELATLPDSLLARWPPPVPLRMSSDARRLDALQAAPRHDPALVRAERRAANLRTPLLWLALLLFAVERILAARGGDARGEATLPGGVSRPPASRSVA
jgi:hypothetical protein